MKYKGLLLKESLNDESVLNLINTTKTEIWDNIQNAAEGQPKKWTAIYFEFEGSEEEATIKAEVLSRALKHMWYLNFSTEEEIYVIYPKHKFYKYIKGDEQKKQEAINYGLSIGIPQSQLDWG